MEPFKIEKTKLKLKPMLKQGTEFVPTLSQSQLSSAELFLQKDFLPQHQSDRLPDELLVDKTWKDSICCPVCFFIMKEPITTSCGHSFCKGCIAAAERCPLCNEVQKNISLLKKSIIIQNIIDKQQILCPSHSEIPHSGCVEKITIGNIDEHAKDCHFVGLKCRCNKVIPKNKFLNFDTPCDCKGVQCEYCSKSFEARVLEWHKFQCGKLQSMCETCGAMYVRKDKSEHKKDCLFDCPFRQAGCGCPRKLLPRKELELHLAESKPWHVFLMLKTQKEYKRIYDQLMEKHQKITTKLI